MRALLLLCLAGCGATPLRVPAEIELGRSRVRASVDSELAAVYAQPLWPSPPAPTGRAAELHALWDAKPLDSENLRSLARASSNDFAALYFARRLLTEPRHARAQKRFESALARVRKGERPAWAPATRARYRVVFVPGMFYERNPDNGAAMETSRETLRRQGFDVVFVRSDENASVEANAKVVARYLRQARDDGVECIVVSASKGGPEMAHAIGWEMRDEDTRLVRGWISIGGILGGTPVADHAMTSPRGFLLTIASLAFGADMEVTASLTRERSAERNRRHRYPEHLRVYHYIGVPVSGSVGARVRDNFDRIARWGPNDGIALLGDQMLPQGDAILAIGWDHLFEDPDVHLKTLAAFWVLLEDLGA